METLTVTEQFRGVRFFTHVVPEFLAVVSTGQKRRTIYDAKNNTELPGDLVRGEGDQSNKDRASDEAYDGTGITYDFYKQVYQRNSIDDKGMRLDSTVHYRKSYNNAFWNGSQMVFGDGDGRIFQGFTGSVDVIAHELTHGVTQCEAGLAYWDQPGALNESFSDVFGSLAKQYHLKQSVKDADWLIGAGLFTEKIKGKALRSMAEPGTAYDDPLLGKDPQPGHMKDFVDTTDDNGGVHINSGIPNKAFYLTAMEIGGNAWESAGKIWYITLRDRLKKKSSFKTTANRTFDVAGILFGKDSKEQKAVQKGWQGVGIEVKGISARDLTDIAEA